MVKRCISENGTRTVLLIICSLSYLLVGAAVFSALEYEEDQNRKLETKKLFRDFQAKYNITAEDFTRWAKLQRYQQNIDTNVEQWSFAGSVYFATTVITTIGKSQRNKNFKICRQLDMSGKQDFSETFGETWNQFEARRKHLLHTVLLNP